MASTPHFFIAMRYLRARRGERFISLIAWLGAGGVALGVAAVIVVFSVMTGYQEKLRDKIIGMNAHVSVYPYGGPIADPDGLAGRIGTVEGVEAASAFAAAQAMFAAKGGATGAVLRGVGESPADPAFRAVADALVEGSAEGFFSDPNAILLGRELARALGVGVGDPVRVTIPVGEAPKLRGYRVAGLFSSGMYDFDASVAVTSLASAQSFLGLGGEALGMEVRVKDAARAREIATAVSRLLGPDYWVADWQRMNKNLFSALELQRVVLTLILSLIVFVAAFSVAATLILTVIEKTREIGILKAMGASRALVRRVFALQGLLIGAVGAAAGLALGLGLCLILSRYPLIRIPKDIYLFDTLPVSIHLLPCLLFALGAILLCFVAAVFPAHLAARLDPVRAIRVE